MLPSVEVCAFLSPVESWSADAWFVYMGFVGAWKILVQGGFFFPRRVEDLELPSSSREKWKPKRRMKLAEYRRGTVEVLGVSSSPCPGLWHPGGPNGRLWVEGLSAIGTIHCISSGLL